MMSSERCLMHLYLVLETGNTFLITHIIKNFYIGKKDTCKKAICGLTTTMQGDVMVPCSKKSNFPDYI